jgi:hypothetical protein
MGTLIGESQDVVQHLQQWAPRRALAGGSPMIDDAAGRLRIPWVVRATPQHLFAVVADDVTSTIRVRRQSSPFDGVSSHGVRDVCDAAGEGRQPANANISKPVCMSCQAASCR